MTVTYRKEDGVGIITMDDGKANALSDAMIDAFHRRGGMIRRRVIWIKALASLFSLGSGGAGGREGPTMQIGGALAIFSFLPYCQLRRGNVFVDFFTKGLPIAVRSFLDLVGNGFYLALAVVIALQIGKATHEKFEYADTTTILRIPESWPYLICTFMAWFLVIAITYSLYRSLSEMLRGKLIGPQPSGEH